MEEVVRELYEKIQSHIRELERAFSDTLDKLDVTNFNNYIHSKRVAVVLFTAKWCNPCRLYLPIVRRIARRWSKKYSDIGFGFVDTDESPSIADRYSIQNLPSIIIYVRGKPVELVEGLVKESDLQGRLEAILSKIGE